jgi:hypothetical protein
MSATAAPARLASLVGQLHRRPAHVPIGTTADKGFDIDEMKSRIVESAIALTAIGADIEIGRATP